MKTYDIGLLLLALAVIIVVARLFGAIAKRIGQPPVVGEIVAGIVLGPSLLGPVLTGVLFPAALRPALDALANIGLVLFMFIVGYELDKNLIRGRKRVAATVSIGSVALPMILGAGLGLWLAKQHNVTQTVPFVLFIAAAMSVTAFPVLARILTDKHLHRTKIGGIALASAAIDDVLAWSLLAVVVTVAGTSTNQWRALFVPAYLAVMFLAVRPLLKRLAKAHSQHDRPNSTLMAAILVGLLLSAFAAEWIGIHFIFGAFLFGIIMPRVGAEELRRQVRQRLEQVSVLLLLPVFFVVAGFNINLTELRLTQLLELVMILAVAITGKFLGAYGGARSAGIGARQASLLATLMNTRGLTEIVILTVGLQMGILDTSLFSLMVLMALTTTAMAGPLMRIIYPQHLIQRDRAEAAAARAAEQAPINGRPVLARLA